MIKGYINNPPTRDARRCVIVDHTSGPCCLRHVHDACRLMGLPLLPFCFPFHLPHLNLKVQRHNLINSTATKKNPTVTLSFSEIIPPQTRPKFTIPSMKRLVHDPFGECHDITRFPTFFVAEKRLLHGSFEWHLKEP